MTLPRPTLPRHRYITATGWAWVVIIAFWIAVALLVAKCA